MLPPEYGNCGTALAVLAARRQQSRGSAYINVGDQQSGDDKRLYSMGFYTVDIKRWRLTRISHRPTLTAWKNRWRDTRLREGFIKNSPNYLVVFPAGIVDLGKSLAVSYGWNDCRCYIGAYDKQDVSDSLITIG